MTKIFLVFIFLSGFISLLFSFLLYYKRRSVAPFAVFFTLALAALSYGLSVLDFGDSTLVTLRKLSYSTLCLLGISYNYYGLTFGGQAGGIKLAFPLVLLAGLLLFSLASLPTGWIVDSVYVEDDEVIYFHGAFGKPFILMLSVGLAVAIANLEWIYRSARGSSRWRVKYLSWGLIWGAGFCLFFLGYPLVYGFDRTSVVLGTGAALSLSFYPSAYVILRRKALETGLYVSRQVAYGSLVVVFLGIYFIALGLVIRIFYSNQKFGFPQIALVVFILSIVGGYIFLSEGLRRRAMALIASNFYSTKYDYRRVWNEFSKDISNYLTPESLIPPMSEAVGEILGAKWVAYFENYQGVWRQVYGNRISFPSELSDMKSLSSQTIVRIKSEESAASVAVVLKGGNQEILALIALGAKISAEDYDYEDEQMLKTLGEQTSRRIYEAKLSQEATSYREIESATKMSAFLLHDLKNVASMLSMVIKNAPRHFHDPAFQDDLLLTLRDTEERIRGLMTNISIFPGELNLKLARSDLGRLLQRVVSRFTNQRINVEFLREGGDLEFYFDENLLEKLFVNIILNASQALEELGGEEGGRVSVQLLEADGWTQVRIRDDGPGIAENMLGKILAKPFQTTKKGGAGVGLYQCRLIAEAHGGGIEVESEPGKGAEFIISIPINTEHRPWKRNYS
ncbi:MAG: ATP-binding protein [Deltaproteobacteria bacterium]